MLGLIGFVRSIEETPATIDSIVLHPIFQGALPIAVRLLSVTPFKSERGNIAFSCVEHTWKDLSRILLCLGGSLDTGLFSGKK